MTYKDIVETIETIVLDHKEINNFGYGMLSDIKPKANQYPYVFLNPVTHTRQDRQTTYSFNLIVMDLVNTLSPSPDKKLIVEDRCIKIILDILSKIEYSLNQEIDFRKAGSITTFVERFDDEVAGATFQLSIVISDPFDSCDAPFNVSTNDYLNNLKATSLYSFVVMLRGLTEQHKMLKSFYYGFLSDIKFNELTQVNYPYVFLLPTDHTYTKNIITYRFNLIITDLVKGDTPFYTETFDNYLTIQSNAIQYGFDLLSTIRVDDRFSNIDFIKSFNIDTFVERFEDELTGATFTIEIQIPTSLNLCDAPYNTI
jgi:hypothetical protein